MIFEIILWACVAVLMQCAEPIIHIKRYLGFKEELYDTYSKEKRFFHRLIYCTMCLGFWITLVGTWDIGVAIIASVLSTFIYKKIIE
jgi:hypothetical protein